MKKILLIVMLILVVGLGLYLARGYIFKFASLPTPTATQTATTPLAPSAPEPTSAASQALSQLAPGPIFDYWVDQSDRTVYFMTADGGLYRMSAGGSPEQIFNVGISDVALVIPAPKGISALVEGGYPQNPFFSVINPTTRTRQFLPLGALAAAWSPDAKEVVFIKNNKTLNIFTIATAKSRLVGPLNMVDVVLDWKKSNEIYLGSRPSTGVASAWWSYNLDKKTIREITGELPGMTVSWGTGGTQGLQFTNSSDTADATLSVIEPGSSFASSLNLITLPTKCLLDGTNVYCGVPIFSESTQFPDAYYQKKIFTSDNIVLIDLARNNRHSTLYNGAAADTKLDIYHLTKVGNSIYFINRYDNKLYSLSL